MGPRYFTLSCVASNSACEVGQLTEDVSCFDLSMGVSFATTWPRDMAIAIRRRGKLLDLVSNAEAVVLASPKLQAFLRAQEPPGLELLRVSIVDAKKQVVADDYCVVNCCRIVDCVDQKKSEFEWDDDELTSMTEEKLVLKPKALGKADRMIRPRYVAGPILFREDLVEAMRAQRFAGLAFSREIFGDATVYR